MKPHDHADISPSQYSNPKTDEEVDAMDEATAAKHAAHAVHSVRTLEHLYNVSTDNDEKIAIDAVLTTARTKRDKAVQSHQSKKNS